MRFSLRILLPLLSGVGMFQPGFRTNPDAGGLIHIRGRITDAATGRPTAARLHFSGLDGTYYAPAGHQPDFPVRRESGDLLLNRSVRYAYVNGTFDVWLPPGPVAVRVVKGFEYAIHEDTVAVSPTLQVLEIPLRRFHSFPDDRWYGGDGDIHYVRPAQGLLEGGGGGVEG